MKIILTLLLLTMVGCSHDAYKPQKIDIARHTLVLHETEIAMQNAYELAWSRYPDKVKRRGRGEYGGFIDYGRNELHCYGPWPEECILHEYKHLGSKYGLVVPDDKHFKYGR